MRAETQNAARGWGPKKQGLSQPGAAPFVPKGQNLARGVLQLQDQSSALPPIFSYLDDHTPLRYYEHVAILHGLKAPAVPWARLVSEGLHLGNWCYYLAPPILQKDLLTRLREFGVNVERHLEVKSLQFPPDVFNPKCLVDSSQSFFASAEGAHAPAVRWLEVGMRPGTEILPSSQYFEFHSRLNYLVKHYPSVALCHYDVEDLDIPHLFSAISVHRHLLVEGTLVRDNPFYIPAEKFLRLSPAERDRDLREVFRTVGFDVSRLLATLAGYGQLQVAYHRDREIDVARRGSRRGRDRGAHRKHP